MDNNNELFSLIDLNAKTLVGQLLKRLEILEAEKALTPSLFRALVREHVYESARNLKAIIKIGKLEFRSRPKE